MLHLGGEEMVPLCDVLMILDMQCAGKGDSLEFLRVASEEGFVREIAKEEAKSAVLVEHKGRVRVYLSPISSLTLFKRARVSARARESADNECRE